MVDRVCVRRVAPCFSAEDLEWANLVRAVLDGKCVSTSDHSRLTDDLLSMGVTLQIFRGLSAGDIAAYRARYRQVLGICNDIARKRSAWWQFKEQLKFLFYLVCFLLAISPFAYLLDAHPGILAAVVLFGALAVWCYYCRKWIVSGLGLVFRSFLKGIRFVRRLIKKIEEETIP